MWVKNNEKERIKSYIKSDIDSHVTNITDTSNHIHEIISSIDRAVSGSLSGKDQELIGDCQRAIEELSNALQNLHTCRGYVDRLETKEWVEDEQH